MPTRVKPIQDGSEVMQDGESEVIPMGMKLIQDGESKVIPIADGNETHSGWCTRHLGGVN